MKILTSILCISFGLLSFIEQQDESIQFVCKRKIMSTNRCHYNFKVNGGKFRYVDIGCRFKKQAEVIEKVKTGELALAKDWEIECGGQEK